MSIKSYFKDGVLVQNTLDSGEDIIVKDRWNREYHFKIASFPVPTGMMSEAIEVKEGDPVGYKFHLLSNFDIDLELAKELLIKKIKRGINRRYLVKRDGAWEIGSKDKLYGRIEYNDDFSDTQFERVFVIDGKRITIEEFGRMVEPFEGWNFAFKILDQCGEDT